MKSYVAAAASPSKRRWKGFAAAVLALVFFSLLVPLAFLLGLHNRFPAGYLTDDRSSSASSFEGYGKAPDGVQERNPSEGGQSRIVDDLIRKFGPGLPKDMDENALEGRENVEDFVSPRGAASKKLLPAHVQKDDLRGKANAEESVGDVVTKPCQLQFGTYCLWSVEHKEDMKDSIVKKLKDQLFVARAYYPSIAKLHSEEFSHQVKQSIQDHERMLSEAIVDADLPSFVGKRIEKMEETIAKAKTFRVSCNNVDKKLTQILDLTEDEAQFHKRQSAFLYHLGVQTTPKSLHCLSLRLTVEYFKNSSHIEEGSHLVTDGENPTSEHYVIFSKNVLASSVTINSTVVNAKVSKNLVFHLLTDEENYYALKFWFSRNSYKEATVHVVNIEKMYLNDSGSRQRHLSFSEEFRITIRDADLAPSVQMRTEYMSIFGHAHFLLPEIFKNLKKVVVLDDDIVVQKDLSPLWGLDLKGKVIAAVQFCKVRLGHLKSYFTRKVYKDDSCAWMSGINIVDLEKWREYGITDTYQMLLKEMQLQSTKTTTWRAAALPISLLAFQNLVHPLNDTWVQSGLGKDYGVSKNVISNAPVLHYNGNMKPWLDLGIPKYKKYWKNFVRQGNNFMDECNANP